MATREFVVVMTLFETACEEMDEKVKMYSVFDNRPRMDLRRPVLNSFRVVIWRQGSKYGMPVKQFNNYEDCLTCFEEEVLAMLTRWQHETLFQSIG